MVTSKELSYRTLDQLIDSCRIDLKSFSSDGNIEVQEVIKIAQMCNYELGLAITQTKETILEIEHHRAKMPADFQFLNFALLCHKFRVVTPSPNTGNMTREFAVSIPPPNITTCPCWNIVSTGYQTRYVDCHGETQPIFFPPGESTLCAASIDNTGGAGGSITISTDHFCFNDPNTATFTCDIPDNCGCTPSTANACAVVNADPWNQNKVYTICDNTIGITVVQICSNEVRHYEYFSPVYLTPSRHSSAFMNPQRNSMNAANQAMLKDGFLQFVIPCGQVYINYQGLLEDDQGNLLVLDHPKINEYYEFAIKKRIIENLYINGEPDLERRLQYVNEEYRKAKVSALTIVNTPDHRVMTETFQIIRKNALQRFAAPVSRMYGKFAGLSFIDQYANGRYAE